MSRSDRGSYAQCITHTLDSMWIKSRTDLFQIYSLNRPEYTANMFGFQLLIVQ